MESLGFPLPATPEREFAMLFSSTPRGARLARRLVSQYLESWGHDYDSPLNEKLTLITAELAANAVCHGYVPDGEFKVRLTLGQSTARLEVSDTRTERKPPKKPQEPQPDAESGRGLLLVAALAERWGTVPRPAAPGKTVWAECTH
ncbi:ATP-binding protein [Kitasatospora acidiphila]|uniref:ATP-binding protein n=1 Tax=Kitasatospora acidiphila TaxID=2567942 RepID=UPI003C751648